MLLREVQREEVLREVQREEVLSVVEMSTTKEYNVYGEILKFQGCIIFYYFLFYSLEEVGLLDPASEVEVCAFCFVYRPILQCQVGHGVIIISVQHTTEHHISMDSWNGSSLG